MADPLHIFVQALYLFGIFLEQVSPLPWPLGIAVLLPVYAIVLSGFVWWMRGMLWPVFCDYHNTTTGHPCRNRVLGEWRRCHQHNRARRRSTDGHVINPNINRWEEETPEGKIVERKDLAGVGFFRLRSKRVTPLWHKGYARRLANVRTFFPQYWRSQKNKWRALPEQLKERNFRLRDLLKPSATPAQLDVSDRLPTVIRATRLTLVFAALGLMLVIIAVELREAVKHPIIVSIEYVSTVMFVVTWAIAKEGIFGESGGGGWLHEAGSEIAATCIVFFFLAAVVGLLNMASLALNAGF